MNMPVNKMPRFPKGASRRGFWRAWVILLAGLIATVLATFYTKSEVDEDAKQDFDFVCKEIQIKIQDRLKAHEQVLRSGAAFFEQSDGVTRQEWHLFTAHQNVEQQLPGIQGIGFAVLIPRQQLAQHVQNLRAEGFPDYQVRPVGEREFYSSTIYLEPFTNRNLRAFGYDMFSEPVRRLAMERARDQDVAALSGKVILVQETEKDIQAGTLLYLPVYRMGMSHDTIPERRAAIQGWVYSPYRMNDLLQGILGGWDLDGKNRIHMQIFDTDKVSLETLLYDSQPGGNQSKISEGRFILKSGNVSAGRLWTLRFSQTGSQLASKAYSKMWLVLLGGLITSLLLSGLLFSVLNTQFKAWEIANHLTTELRQSEERYRMVIEQAAEGIFTTDDMGHFLDINTRGCQMYGYTREEYLGLNIIDLLHPTETADHRSFLEAILHGEMIRREWLTRRKDGSTIMVETSAGRLRDGRLLAVVRDITDRKQAEKALQRRESLLNVAAQIGRLLLTQNDLQQALNDAIQLIGQVSGQDRAYLFEAHVDPATNELFVSQRYEWVRSGITDQIHNRALLDMRFAKMMPVFNERLRQGLTICAHVRDLPANERDILTAQNIVSIILVPVEVKGHFLGFIGFDNCQTEYDWNSGEQAALNIVADAIGGAFRRKRAEKKLYLESEFNRLVIENAGHGICVCHVIQEFPYVRFTVWNNCMTLITAYSMEQINRLGWYQSVYSDPSVQERAKQRMQRIYADEQMQDEEWEITRADGHKRQLLITTRFHPAGKDVPYVLAVMSDITERKETECKLRAAALYSRNLIEASLDPLVTISIDGMITDANAAFEKITGLNREKIIGSDFADYFTEPEKARAGYRKAFEQGQVLNYPLAILHISGTIAEVCYNASVYRDEQGVILGVFAAARDITEHKQAEVIKEKLEAQNRQMQKSESLSRMAGAIAHLFNSQLQAVMMGLELLKDNLSGNAEATETLVEAQIAARKAAEVSSLMLVYLGQTRSVNKPLDISEACQLSLPLLRAVIPKGVVFETDLPTHGPVICGNMNQIQQVLTNLVSNAWEANSDGVGYIRLTVKKYLAADIPITQRFPSNWNLQDSAYACMEVTDVGHGMQAQNIDNIFDPFYTTKFTGRGMGLAVVLGIVRAHGGVVTVTSKRGQGSVFRVFLPLSTETVTQKAVNAIQNPKLVRGVTILLVEDESSLRRTATLGLKGLGFTVLTAVDGVEAVEVFKRHQSEIQVVLCDLTMPRMDGWKTLEELRKLAPGIPVIISSGYSEEQVLDDRSHSELPHAILTKPYGIEMLAAAIAQVLAKAK